MNLIEVSFVPRTSRDSMLLVLKEIYGDMGVLTDNQLPQTILPFDITSDNQRSKDPSRDPTPVSSASSPAEQSVPLGPPPTFGFVKK